MLLLKWLANAVVVGAALLAAGMLLVFGGSFWAIALPLAVAGAVCLGAGVLRARRRPDAGSRHQCLDCGASVPAGMSVCQRCGSVAVGMGGRVHAGGGRGAIGRGLPVAAYSPDASGVIGWVDAAPPGGQEAGPDDPGRTWRSWAGLLLLGAGCFAALGTADALESWPAALLVLVAAAGVAAAVMRWRPRPGVTGA